MANSFIVFSEREPLFCLSSPIMDGYFEGSITTATDLLFFAALRSIDGPPMSIFSIASSIVTPVFATVFSKG